MIDFKHLNGKELITHGWIFETREEADLFAAMIIEELEVRIGQAISDQVGFSTIERFDMCANDEEFRMWLEQNCPNYKEIIKEQQRVLENEMLLYLKKMPILAAPLSPSSSDDR